MGKTRKQRNDWVIAIPSYKRAETLRDKTLKVLSDYHIPVNRIHVFVANKEEYQRYKEVLDPKTYGHIRIAKPGMAAVRNYITSKAFPIGKPIFNMDDDIRGFVEYSSSAARNEKPLRSLTDLINKGFAEARKTGFRLFGTYPIPNGFFMKPTVTTDLRYLPGGAWGIINPGPILTLTLDDKEDYLRTIMMYILDGGVIKFNGIAPLTVGYQGDGGMQEERTITRIDRSARAMVEAFPDLVKLNMTKKSGKPEVRLRDSRPEEEREFGEAALLHYKLPSL
jgi:hypothetical protein